MIRPAQPLAVLAALDAIDEGAPAPRRQVEPRRVREVLCKYGCGKQVYICYTQSGGWCAVERSEPLGDMVIVDATVRARAELHADAHRFSFHRCRT